MKPVNLTALEEIEKTLYKENIETYHVKLGKQNAVAVEAGGKHFIGIDKRKTSSIAEEAILIAHEGEHIRKNLLYDKDAPQSEIDRIEHRVWRSVVKEYLPRKELARAMRRNGGRMWEVAEDIGYPEWFIDIAYHFYFELRIS